MCGRFSRASTRAALATTFEVELPPDIEVAPRWNVCPGEDVLTVVDEGRGRVARWLRWGLVPWFARDPRGGARAINARVETAAERPAFRDAFQRRRCLVLADGFYEWHGTGAARAPYYVRHPSGAPIAFAGLWERWSSGPGSTLATCTILTRPAAGPLAAIHHRMPVLLAPAVAAGWLDPLRREPAAVHRVLGALPDVPLESWPVSRLVNSPRHDSAACAAPV